MSEAYRENRIRVTDDIEDAVFDLIEAENDIGTKKKHPAKWYQTETARSIETIRKNQPFVKVL